VGGAPSQVGLLPHPSGGPQAPPTTDQQNYPHLPSRPQNLSFLPQHNLNNKDKPSNKREQPEAKTNTKPEKVQPSAKKATDDKSKGPVTQTQIKKTIPQAPVQTGPKAKAAPVTDSKQTEKDKSKTHKPVTLESIFSIIGDGREAIPDADAPLNAKGVDWLIEKFTLVLNTLAELRASIR
jgi:hypothetical protein